MKRHVFVTLALAALASTLYLGISAKRVVAAKNEGGERHALPLLSRASVAIALPRRLSCGRIANETWRSIVVPTDEGQIHVIRYDDKSRKFVSREVAAGFRRSYDSAVTDIDLDGINDIVTLTLENSSLEAAMAELVLDNRIQFKPKNLRRNLRYPYGLSVGDLNGDKQADIAFVEYEGGAVHALINQGHGLFSDVLVSDSVSGGQTVLIADLDRDDRADLVSTARSGSKVIVHFQDPQLKFIDQVVSTEIAEPNFATAVDLDSDGDLDILFSSRVSPDLYLVENLGPRSFAKPVALVRNVRGTYSIVPHDLDGDGDLDLLSASITDSVVRAHYNNEARGFSTQVVDAKLQNAQSIAKCDLDGDGRTDFAVSGAQANEVRIYSLR